MLVFLCLTKPPPRVRYTMTTVTKLPRNTVDCGFARTYRGTDQCLLIAKLGSAIFIRRRLNPEKVAAPANQLKH
jgi:hypothetical protein